MYFIIFYFYFPLYILHRFLPFCIFMLSFLCSFIHLSFSSVAQFNFDQADDVDLQEKVQATLCLPNGVFEQSDSVDRDLRKDLPTYPTGMNLEYPICGG